MGVLRDAMEEIPMDEFQQLTYKVVHRTRDEEKSWTPELEILFALALADADHAVDVSRNRTVSQIADLIHAHREAFARALTWNVKPRTITDARNLIDDMERTLLELRHGSGQDPQSTLKLSIIRGNYNVPTSTSPGILVLVRNDADDSILAGLQWLPGLRIHKKMNEFTTSYLFPRGGYSARAFDQGSVVICGDHTNSAQKISYKDRLQIDSRGLVAIHGLVAKPLPDFFQNVAYYPNGERNPYRDPALHATMKELDVAFDHDIFHNPWLEDQDTFGPYER